MKNSKLENLDFAMKEIKEREIKSAPFLNKQAYKIEKIDKTIKYYEDKIKALEKSKQDELEVMQELFDTAVTTCHRLPNGYTVAISFSRKMKIENVQEFLLWLKQNCTPKEVLDFFDGALKSTAIKKFVEKQCDKQRIDGEIDPKVSGIDIGDINFRRLTTYYKGDK